ncbi:hypothetical protein ASPCAL04937 [Aspergillus calidoustus]|uniref:Uncharacterized protein n=1 Tax=Aspergillus calidoustus TaxID=454130 RepID=A0A0U5FVY7_ASPCI|nr:hypothetical protein ASPCAL04937 [Aspergillus calidoustus]
MITSGRRGGVRFLGIWQRAWMAATCRPRTSGQSSIYHTTANPQWLDFDSEKEKSPLSQETRDVRWVRPLTVESRGIRNCRCGEIETSKIIYSKRYQGIPEIVSEIYRSVRLSVGKLLS